MTSHPATAVEFAAGRGHMNHPLLSAKDSPASRVPCVDFSPWLRERLASGDEVAAIAYVLEIVAANPGIGMGIDMDSPGPEMDQAGSMRWAMIPHTSPMWARHWIKDARSVLGAPTDGLTGLTPDALLDLRTALVILCPLGPLDEFALVSGGQAVTYLASVMAPYEIQLSDPHRVVDQVNAVIHGMRVRNGSSAWDEINDLTLEAVIAPWVHSPHAERVARLPLGARAHLADLGRKKSLQGPAAASNLGPFYETRRHGYDAEEGLHIMCQHGLLDQATDPSVLRAVIPMTLLKADLEKQLDLAGVPHPKSATKKRLVALLEEHAPLQIDRLVEQDSVFELTATGRATSLWLAERADATTQLWAAWLSTSSPRRPRRRS